MDGQGPACRIAARPVTQGVERVGAVPVKSTDRFHVKLAGVLGATAVAALAYSAHGFRDEEKSEQRYRTFKNGAHIHILHALALLCAQSSRYPKLTSTLLLTGTVLFSGTCYYTALSKDTRFVNIAPIGGSTLIASWLSFVL